MYIKTVKTYRDKNTKEIFRIGSVREIGDERGKELITKKFVIKTGIKNAEAAKKKNAFFREPGNELNQEPKIII